MDFSAFLGSVWFALFAAACGYILGNIFPLRRIFPH